MVQINRLKAAATGAVMDELENYKKQTVETPFGNLIGGDFFTGRGPYIPINEAGGILRIPPDLDCGAAVHSNLQHNLHRSC